MPSTRTAYEADFAAARAVLPDLGRRLADLIARIPDRGAPSPLRPWTVEEVAAHLSVAYYHYAASTAGDLGEWEPMPHLPEPIGRLQVLNPQAFALVGPEERAVLGELLVERVKIFLEASADRDPTELIAAPWFGDTTRIPIGAAAGLMLSEGTLHGLDIARGSGRPWPIDKPLARLIGSLVYPTMMPMLVNAKAADGLTARIHMHIRGGITIGVEAVDGAVRVRREAVGRADCHISLDPVAFLLTASGRGSQNKAIAAGKMIPYGRKPWLAPRASRLFLFP